MPDPAMPKVARRPPTSHDVALAAGVSQSAVSRAFGDSPRISPATRARIIATAERLNYRPNALARSLSTTRSKLIGVAVGRLANLFNSSFLDVLCRSLKREGYHTILFPVGGDEHPESEDLADMLQYGVDGLLLAATTISMQMINECRARGVPIVLLNQSSPLTGVSSVSADNERGGQLAAGLLAAGQHRRFAYLSGPSTSTSSQERGTAYAGWLFANGFDAPRHADGNYTFPEAWAAAKQLLSHADPPDALFCADDHMAIAAIEVARQEFGLRVGHDISIVGFEDIPAAGWPSYDITTFSLGMDELVGAALGILLADIETFTGVVRRHVVAGELVVRTSARRPVTGCAVSSGRVVWCGD